LNLRVGGRVDPSRSKAQNSDLSFESRMKSLALTMRFDQLTGTDSQP
jgi:hypothetical protein